MPFRQIRFNEEQAQFSPDGKWIVYESDESGRFEIYAAPFPGPGPKLQISSNGGAQPRWRSNGREIFYYKGPLSSRLSFRRETERIEVGATHTLFPTPRGSGGWFDLTSDAQRFLWAVNVEQNAPATLTLIQNWPALVKN